MHMIKTKNIMERETLNMRRLASFKSDSQNRELSVLHRFVTKFCILLNPTKGSPKQSGSLKSLLLRWPVVNLGSMSDPWSASIWIKLWCFFIAYVYLYFTLA